MADKRVPLYERLPEIYRIKDESVAPPYQLKRYLALVEAVFGAVHENIEALYNDLFIETCDPWVIPYIGDLLGTSHLSGDPWTLRADVADTIALRRRKGTLASLERLTYNLTKWGVHCVELLENLIWNQHLNHQRPDEGGDPPYAEPTVTRFTPIRGGTVNVRDPAMLSLLGTPFDPFAHVADVRPPAFGDVSCNLPNLVIFLWRLKDYRVRYAKPAWAGSVDLGTVVLARFDLHPLGQPVRLLNTYQFDPTQSSPVITELDRVPGFISRARLTQDSAAGNPQAYFSIDTYDPSVSNSDPLEVSDVGLQFHLPIPEFGGETWPDDDGVNWTVRGEELYAWEDSMVRSLADRQIAIDPEYGRVIIGVSSAAEADALKDHMFVTYTYGAVGQVGAHPATRQSAAPQDVGGESVVTFDVNLHASGDPDELRKSLDDLDSAASPRLVEIHDSLNHVLDLSLVQGKKNQDGGPNLNLAKSLIIRAADGQRPIIKLKQPLRFRPKDPTQAAEISVRLEGLYLTRDSSFPAHQPLIARAAVDKLEIVECTLDPGGAQPVCAPREAIETAMKLSTPYGFPASEAGDFDQIPEIVIHRSICGPLAIDRGYQLTLSDSILDAGKGIGDDSTNDFALSSVTNPADGYGPPTQVNGLTVFGRMRVETLSGRGGIWVHKLEVLDNQRGCIRYSYISSPDDRIPQNLGCVFGTQADLSFVSEIFGAPGYAQVAWASDFRIRERGPNDDQMGAYGFLLEAHKWRNLQIRFREFMPVGVRPILVPVT
ncbi:MAG: hypothetical protein P8Z42_13580 [Anaerolineales bacterium]